MGQFQVSNSEFQRLLNGGDISKLYQALKRSIEDWDYKSGIVAKPADGVFYHGLGVVPKLVMIQGYDTQNAENYVQENATSVTRTTITVGGAKAFYNVLAER